ncbi:uncharacterized protein LOC143428210 [Xylocopa sonorina]|uniref:uncharacterized protein LOC143428210 n=1 Tax=Xylocopa sonorina TaxID=1818115 RepID=UPI00403AB3D3
MKNSLDIENEYFNEEYSSLCSSCNSILQSICSIGVPSICESNFENDDVKTQVQKDVTDAKNIDTIHEDISKYIPNSYIKEETALKDIGNSTENSLIIIGPRIYGTQKMNEKNNDKVSCSKTKEIKNVESLNKVSTKHNIISIKRLNSKNNFSNIINSKRILCVNKNSDNNYATLSNVTSKSSMLMKPTLDNMLHYEPLMENMSQTAKENTIIQSMTSNNDSSSTNLSLIKVHNKSDYIKRDVLNQRKKVLKTIDSILHLW